MTQEQIKQAAEEYATKYYRRSATDIWSIAKLGFQAGANWVYQHGCVDTDTAELAGYKRGVERAIEVLRATGYFSQLSEVEGLSEAAMEEQFRQTMTYEDRDTQGGR